MGLVGTTETLAILLLTAVLAFAGCSSAYDGLEARVYSKRAADTLVEFQLLRVADSGFERVHNSSVRLAPSGTTHLGRLTTEAGSYKVVVRDTANETSREFSFRPDPGPGWVDVVLKVEGTRIELGYG